MPGIFDVIAVVDDREVTVLDRTLETLRVGGLVHDAAARCGIDTGTMNRWLREGARVAADVLAGRRASKDLDDHERDAMRFHHAVAQAEADGKVTLLRLSQHLAQGGIPVTTTTTKVSQGRERVLRDDGTEYLPALPPIEEVTTKVERTLPDSTMIRFRLERGWPDEWGRASRLELTGADGGPIELVDRTPIDRLMDALDNLAAQRQAAKAAIEVQEVESLPPAEEASDGD